MSTMDTAKNGSDTTMHGAAADRRMSDQPYSSMTGAESITMNSVQPAARCAALTPSGGATGASHSTPSASRLTTSDTATSAPSSSICRQRKKTNAHAAASSSSIGSAARRLENSVAM